MKVIFLTLSILFISLANEACPLCNSTTAKEIRSSLLGPDLPFNVFVTVLPFIIFSLIVYFISNGGFNAQPGRDKSKNP